MGMVRLGIELTQKREALSDGRPFYLRGLLGKNIERETEGRTSILLQVLTVLEGRGLLTVRPKMVFGHAVTKRIATDLQQTAGFRYIACRSRQCFLKEMFFQLFK